MISAQRFVKEWRLAHESVTNESLARMLVEYAEQFIAEARADERERMAHHGRAFAVSAVAGREADLRGKVEALPTWLSGSSPPVLALVRADVLALLDGGSE